MAAAARAVTSLSKNDPLSCYSRTSGITPVALMRIPKYANDMVKGRVWFLFWLGLFLLAITVLIFIVSFVRG